MNTVPLEMARFVRHCGYEIRRWSKRNHIVAFRMQWNGAAPLGELSHMVPNSMIPLPRTDPHATWQERCEQHGWLEIQRRCNELVERYRVNLEEYAIEISRGSLADRKLLFQFHRGGKRYLLRSIQKAA